MSNVLVAFGLTLFAGMATGVGSILAFAVKRTDYRFLSVATGFSAGVMLYVSFVEILAKGLDALVGRYGDYWGAWLNVVAFFAGILLIALIDNVIPSAENPHEAHTPTETAPLHDPSAPMPVSYAGLVVPGGTTAPAHPSDSLMRTGLFTALAIGLHNFPEGLATFLAALDDPTLGLAIAVAIALHNIPEGISVSVPIFYATGDRRKAFVYSFLSGLAEPIGAGLAYLVLLVLVGRSASAIPSEIMGLLFAAVAGIMVYISLDELLPTSRAYGRGHDSLLGLVAGMAVMAMSLLLVR